MKLYDLEARCVDAGCVYTGYHEQLLRVGRKQSFGEWEEERLRIRTRKSPHLSSA